MPKSEEEFAEEFSAKIFIVVQCPECSFSWVLNNKDGLKEENFTCHCCGAGFDYEPEKMAGYSRDPDERFRELLTANNQLLERARNAENVLQKVLNEISYIDDDSTRVLYTAENYIGEENPVIDPEIFAEIIRVSKVKI